MAGNTRATGGGMVVGGSAPGGGGGNTGSRPPAARGPLPSNPKGMANNRPGGPPKLGGSVTIPKTGGGAVTNKPTPGGPLKGPGGIQRAGGGSVVGGSPPRPGGGNTGSRPPAARGPLPSNPKGMANNRPGGPPKLGGSVTIPKTGGGAVTNKPTPAPLPKAAPPKVTPHAPVQQGRVSDRVSRALANRGKMV